MLKIVFVYDFVKSGTFGFIAVRSIRIGAKYSLICHVEFNTKLGMFLERGNKVIIIIITYF